MTVASVTNRVSYAGNGTTTDFAFPHPYRASSDLVVTLRTTATGAEVAQVEGVNYTVSGTPTSDAGGFASATVSFGTAPASGTQVHIDRMVARTQTTDYVAGDGIPPSSIEGSLDKLTQLVQELDSRFERTLLQPRTAANRNLVLPEPTSGTASRVLSVNAGGTAYELRAPDGIPNGDKGDITVSGAGDTWTIDANAVTTAKIADGAVTAGKIGDAELSALAGLTSAANKLPYFTGSGTAALTDLTVAGRDLIAGADATAQRGILGLGTMATQAANSIAITGGSITGIADLAIADGGTGASTAANARTNLGLTAAATNTVEQEYDTVAAVNSATIDSTINHIRTAGYYAAGDGGGALYKRVGAATSGIPSINSNSGGVLWELSEHTPNLRQFGGVGDNAANDTNAVSAAVAFTEATGRPVFVPQGTYLTDPFAIDAQAYALQALFFGNEAFSTVIKRRTTGSTPFLTIGSLTGTAFQALVSMSKITIDGGANTNGPACRIIDAVRSRFEEVVFRGGDKAVQMFGGISNTFEHCNFSDAKRGLVLDKFPTNAFTADAGTDVVTYTSPPQDFDLPTGTKVRFTTTGTLPAGLSLATDYYLVRQSATTAKVATSLANAQAGTPVVDITSAGSGTHTLTTLSQAGGGWPNLNRVSNCHAVDNTEWGITFDGGKLFSIYGTQIEGNGVTQGSATGGLYVGTNVGEEVAVNDTQVLGVVVRNCWFEANRGVADVHLNSGINSVQDCNFYSNTSMVTCDIKVDGGKYRLRNLNISFAPSGSKTDTILVAGGVTSSNIVELVQVGNTSASLNSNDFDVDGDARVRGNLGIGRNPSTVTLHLGETSPTVPEMRLSQGATLCGSLYASTSDFTILSQGAIPLKLGANGTGYVDITSGGQTTFPAGSNSAPAITTTGDLNTGIYFPAADTVGIATGGTERVRVTSGGQTIFAVGSAAAPALTATGDTDTGIFFPASGNIVGISAGGSERARITDTGRLGVGIAPDSVLHLGRSGDNAVSIRYTTRTDTTPLLCMNLYASAYDTTLDTVQATPLVLQTNSTTRMTIGATGTITLADSATQPANIAIGTGTGTKIGTATTQKIAFFNATPIVQPASAAQAAVATTAATQTTPWGFTTQAQADGIITLLNEIRTTLVNLGLMKGSA